ncbi:hypothetical protein GCM10023208_25380 [Erythrobacter westpacificensis]|uniref:Uncharacterized protein n=1 Tax=Erythrobacter westpacificensis TaxID=1055231 RepID=A0ABP9KGY7_9SPHN
MSYKVQYMSRGSSLWQTASSGWGSEAQAIFDAKFVAKRPNYEKVRVVDASGSVRWLG